MQKYRRISQADIKECSELQSEYNNLMMNISNSDASDASSSNSFTSSLSTMVSSGSSDDKDTGASGDSSSSGDGSGGSGVSLNADNNNNDNNVFHLPPDLPLERTAMEWGRIAQRIVNRKCYPKANNIRYVSAYFRFVCACSATYIPSKIQEYRFPTS